MVTRVGKRPMERVKNRQWHSTDLHLCVQLFVVEVGKRLKENRPALLPFLLEFCPRNGPVEELFISVTPGLLTVGLEEVRESRLEVARYVPHERRNGVAGGGVRQGQLLVGELLDRRLTELFVSPVFTFDRSYDFAHVPPRSASPHGPGQTSATMTLSGTTRAADAPAKMLRLL